MSERRHDLVVEALGALASYAQIPCRVGARVQCLDLSSRPRKNGTHRSLTAFLHAGMACELWVLIRLWFLLSAAPCRFIFSQVILRLGWKEINIKQYFTACNTAGYKNI